MNDILKNVLMFLTGSTFSSLLMFFINRYDKKQDKRENIQTMLEQMGELKTQLDNVATYGKLNSKAIVLMFRKTLEKECEHWITLGYCPTSERDSLREEFEVYKDHGGNHGVECLYDKVINLPFNPERGDED